MFNIALFEPEIPPNTGNIMRLAANTGCILHLIKPLGFSLDEKNLKRASLDYQTRSTYILYNNLEDFFIRHAAKRIFLCSTKASTVYSSINFAADDVFLFGPESRGLPADLLAQTPESQKITIPMTKNGRSLNLANSVAIVVYEAWRQLNFMSPALALACD